MVRKDSVLRFPLGGPVRVWVVLACTAGLTQWRSMVLLLMAVSAHTSECDTGLTSVLMPPYLGIFS